MTQKNLMSEIGTVAEITDDCIITSTGAMLQRGVKIQILCSNGGNYTHWIAGTLAYVASSGKWVFGTVHQSKMTKKRSFYVTGTIVIGDAVKTLEAK